MFPSLLVANRGEIALRVMRTCRRLGIATVAVYSDTDWAAPHVRAADAAVRIGPGPASESYLLGDVIVGAALATGAAAIHPGYGFLSENASFAEACLAAGLGWVGPPPAAMRAVGDKARAKALAEAIGVPVLPGFHGEAASDADLVGAAGDIGYPLLVKASAGGGGRGMRIVRAPDELAAGIDAARREAAASFGDDRLLLERYVERPRHVEVQVLADAHGNLVHLGERECSIQRRHQKLIEESPSPAVTPDLRAVMGDAALRMARAAGYQGAGTVEFLIDPARNPYFLEVNARLQVEHPVTEAVTGLDLVEQQLRVAAGEPLGFGQADVRPEGHAMELRIVAEDAVAGFLPSTGVVTAFDLPDGVRVDTWVEAGSTISPLYDSLLAKVIAHGPDRATVVRELVDALDGTRIEGVATNLDLLATVLDEPAFEAGDLHTGFIAEHGIVERLGAVPAEVLAGAAAARTLAAAAATMDPWRATVPWRAGRVAEPLRWSAGGRTRITRTTVTSPATAAAVELDDAEIAAERTGGDAETGWFLRLGGDTALVRPATGRRRVETVTWLGRRHRVSLATAPSAAAGGAALDTPDALSAPMPGRIVRINVAEGDHVPANAVLVILEAMKMEHVVAATTPGRVARLHVGVGDQVARGQLLVDLDVPRAD